MVVQGNEAGNIYRHRIQLPQEENQAGGISGNHGRDHSLGRVGRRYQALLSQRKHGRPPMGIEKMLRMYLLQIWFNLSDPVIVD